MPSYINSVKSIEFLQIDEGVRGLSLARLGKMYHATQFALLAFIFLGMGSLMAVVLTYASIDTSNQSVFASDFENSPLVNLYEQR